MCYRCNKRVPAQEGHFERHNGAWRVQHAECAIEHREVKAQGIKKKVLTERGWHAWYNENYWVNPKTVADPKSQNYTDYGMSIDEAMEYESIGCPVHKSMGMPALSRMELAYRTKGLTENKS